MESTVSDANQGSQIRNLRATYLSTAFTLALGLVCNFVSGVLSARLLADFLDPAPRYSPGHIPPHVLRPAAGG
jgi:hypothetical protein